MTRSTVPFKKDNIKGSYRSVWKGWFCFTLEADVLFLCRQPVGRKADTQRENVDLYTSKFTWGRFSVEKKKLAREMKTALVLYCKFKKLTGTFQSLLHVEMIN